MDIPKAKDIYERQELNVVVEYIKKQLIDKINESIETRHKAVYYKARESEEVHAFNILKRDFEEAGYEVSIDVELPTYGAYPERESYYCSGVSEYTLVVSWHNQIQQFCKS